MAYHDNVDSPNTLGRTFPLLDFRRVELHDVLGVRLNRRIERKEKEIGEPTHGVPYIVPISVHALAPIRFALSRNEGIWMD